MIQARKLLVSCALLYANGPLHLGHLLEHIQADIWVRFQRLRGHDCCFISGEDAHGTPIMLAAQKRGISPEKLIQQVFAEHQQDLCDFGIEYDEFYTTHSPENQHLSELIYQRLFNQGDIVIRTMDQAYDPEKNMFLPDRYIKGICPRCDAPEQYGDHCEVCGATYEALSLKQPISVLSGATPITKPSEQYFFKLSHYSDFLKDWISNGAVPDQARRKLLEWFKVGLQDLAISREAPYFGFLIPGTIDKYFYVWLDAPIGYMAIFKHLCQRNPRFNFDDYWLHADQTELYHTIGKDIVNFHALFWPALLKASGFRLPTGLFIHGYLTINGLKMSKSRGTFITARRYLQHLDPSYLRYYFASRINGTIEDIDFNFVDFAQKVNADLVGKFVNIASRCAKLINQHFDQQLSQSLEDTAFITQFMQAGEGIAEAFEKRQYHQAVRQVMALTDRANQYLEEKKPWILVRSIETKSDAQQVCTMGLNVFRILIVYLKPILPQLAAQAEQFLGIPHLTWADHTSLLTGSAIQPYYPLLQRINAEKLQALTDPASFIDT